MFNSVYNVFAPSGMEEEMRNYIKNYLRDKYDAEKCDNIGNLVLNKNGSERKLCIECGMDSLGVMIISKTEEKAYFSGIGGVSAEYLVGKKILFKDKSFGIVRYDGKNIADVKVTDLYIEMDTSLVEVGDFGVIAADFSENSKSFFANEISTRIAIAVVLEAVKAAETEKSVTILFSAQRRFAAKGIQTFFGDNYFDKVITIDGVSCENGVKQALGCAILAADLKGVSDKRLRDEVEALAKKCGVNYQTSVTADNMCIEAIYTSGSGTDCVALGIPVSNRGKCYESVLKTDFDAAVKLLKALIEEL